MDLQEIIDNWYNGNKKDFYRQVKGNEYTIFSKLNQYETINKEILVKMMLTCFYQQEN